MHIFKFCDLKIFQKIFKITIDFLSWSIKVISVKRLFNY